MTTYTQTVNGNGQVRTDLYTRDDGYLCFVGTNDPAAIACQAWLNAGNVPGPFVPTVTGNQWAFALSNMGLASAWRIGVTKSKDSDQVRINLISRSTPLVASDPLLIRVATNAGNDAGGNPLVSVPAVFSTALGMPL